MADPKAVQIAEAEARAKAGIVPGEGVGATETVDTDLAQAESAPQQVQPPQPAAETPPVPPPFISKREEILARYRTDRAARQRDEGDLAGLAQDGAIPLELRTPAPPLQPTDEPGEAIAEKSTLGEPIAEKSTLGEPIAEKSTPAPRRFKVKVHGQEQEISEEELVAKAQIAMASENILDEVKSLKKQLTETLQAARVGQPQHQQQPNAQSPQPPVPPELQEGHVPDQDDSLTKLVEAMQYGDPNDARALLDNVIAQRVAAIVDPAVEQRLQNERLRSEGARTAKVLNDFKEKHSELANDRYAEAAIQTRLYELQVEDIQKLGVDPTKFREPPEVVTPADIAQAHAWYRSNGYSVREPGDMLNQAVGDFMAWKGIKPTPSPAEAAPASEKAPPRVELTVERQQRRSAIPQQPDRAAAPRPPAQVEAPQPRDRSDIVQAMMANRAKPRGKVGVA